MERVKGIEPSSQAWEARILPLNHTRFQFAYPIALVGICKVSLSATLGRLPGLASDLLFQFGDSTD